MDCYQLGKQAAGLPGPAHPYMSNPGQLFKDLGTLTGSGKKTLPTPPPAPKPSVPLQQSAPPGAPQHAEANVLNQQMSAPQQPGAPSGVGPYAGTSTARFAAGLGAKVPATAMGNKAPAWLQSFSNVRPGRTWGQYFKEFFKPVASQFGDDALRASAAGLGGKILPAAVPKAVGVSGGLLAAPFNAGMEGLDAAGALPEILGGTGLGNVGWSSNQDFQDATSVGQAGDNAFGYSGPGWQGLNYLGASMNTHSKPLRSAYNLGEGLIDTPYRMVNNFFKGRDLNAQQAARRKQLDQLGL